MPDFDARVMEWALNALWMTLACAGVATVVDAALLRRCRPSVRERFWWLALAIACVVPFLPRVVPPVAAPAYRIWLEAAAAPASETPLRVPWWTVVAATLVVGRCAMLVHRLIALPKLTADQVDVPLTFGQRILMPPAFVAQASPLALAAARAHEEAHRARRDFAWNLVLEILSLPIALHPAFAWMRRRHADWRERACDEQAASRFAEPHEYARGLLEAAQVLTRVKPARLALGLFDAQSFEERIMSLTEARQYLSPRLARVAAATAFALMLAAAGVGTARAVAVEDPAAAKQDPETTRPRLLSKTEPTYTDEGRRARLCGAVVLGIVVNEGGRAEALEVKRSLEPTLDQAAKDAVSQWVFEPARRKGQPVPFAATVEVNFRIDNCAGN